MKIKGKLKLVDNNQLEYIEKYNNISIYFRPDRDLYTANVYSRTLEHKDLVQLKSEIDKAVQDYVKRYHNLPD